MLFYLDTCIWVDHFEARNETGFPKGDWARKLLRKIVQDNDGIILSDHTIKELVDVGYSRYEISTYLKPFREIIIRIYATTRQRRRAQDLAAKRNVPFGDALHALIARDTKAILVTLDNDFNSLLDIISPKSPRNVF